MSRKNKNIINVQDAILSFSSMDLESRIFNEYQIRISAPDIQNIFFDWYHTSGTLVITTKNYNKGIGKAFSAEEASKIICKELENEENTNG